MEVFKALITVTGWGSAQKAGTMAVCADVKVGIAVKAGVVTVGAVEGGDVWVAAEIGDGETVVGEGRGAAVAGAQAVNRIIPMHRINFLFMAISTGSLY
jgi:hypothetical protein